MPLYEYRAPHGGCEICQTGFEVVQRMSEDPLKSCPQCGNPVEKTISMVSFNKQKSEKKLLSRGNLEKNGFVRYEKSKDGTYVKTAGKEGPETIRKPPKTA